MSLIAMLPRPLIANVLPETPVNATDSSRVNGSRLTVPDPGPVNRNVTATPRWSVVRSFRFTFPFTRPNWPTVSELPLPSPAPGPAPEPGKPPEPDPSPGPGKLPGPGKFPTEGGANCEPLFPACPASAIEDAAISSKPVTLSIYRASRHSSIDIGGCFAGSFELTLPKEIAFRREPAFPQARMKQLVCIGPPCAISGPQNVLFGQAPRVT